MNKQGCRKIVRGVSILFLALVGFSTLWWCVIPQITGQACIDFLSSHVPRQARNQFLDRLFEATVAQEFDWLKTVSSADAYKQLMEIQSSVTTGYEIILKDSLAGTYDYRIRFDNGETVYITIFGEWPSCPDLYVTEDEIFTNIRLESIKLE